MSELNSIAEGSVEKLANDETKKNNNINNTEINKAEAPLSIFIPKKSESPLNLSQPSMPSLVKSKESESSGNIVASPRMSAASRTGSAKVATPTPKIRHRSQSTNNATNSTGQKFGRLSLKSKKNSDQNFHQDQTSSAPIFGNTDGSNPEIESPGSPSSRPSNENIENSSAASSVKRSPRSPERSRISSLLKIRSRESNNEENEVLVGTPVKEGHANYLLMFDMLTGIRISVSRCNSKENKPTEEKLEFVQSHKVAFDESGQEVTPRTDYDFKFKDYAPWIFKKIRDIFHVESSDYLASLTGKYVLSELGSPGKSGSFFYFSSDYRFIIKTIHHSEHIFMRKKLKQYYNHVKDNPDTLLSRILGLHRVKLPGNKKIHFVVMGNVFPAHKDIHEIYDLKGSTIGRVFNEEEALKNPASVLKDINWINRKQNLQFGPTKKKTLINQMEKDVKYLQDNQIMDYSLLIGIHDMVKGNKELLREKSLQVVDEPIVSDNQTDATPVRKPTLKRNTQKQKRLRTVSDPVLLTPINSKLSSNLPPERKYCTFYQDFGGYQATNEEDVIRPIVYYIGIIDIFTHYNYKKKAETYFRSLSNDSKKISSVKPKFYGERFLKFMKNSISEKNPSTTDGLKSNLKNKDFNPKHPDKKIIKKKYKVKLKPIEIKKNAHRKELSNSILKVFDPQNQLVDAQEHYRYFKEKYEHIMENLGEPEDLINRNEFISEKLKTTKSCRTKMLLNAKVNKDLFSSQVSKLNADNAFGIKNYYLEPLLTFNDAIGINKERKLQLLDREQLEIDSLPIQLDESDDDDFTQISSDFKKSLIIKQISNRSIHEEEEEGKNIIDYEKMISQNTGIQKEDKSKVDTPKADTKAYSYENLLSSLDKNIENTPDYGARSLLPNINPNSLLAKLTMPGNKGKYFVASQGEDRIKGMIAMIFADKLINTDERRCKELLGGMAQKLQLEGVSLAELMHNPLLNTGKVVETASAQQSIQIDSTRVKKEEVNTITSFVKLKEETRKVSNLGKLRKNVRGIKALNLFIGMHNKEVKEKVEDPQEEDNQEEINEAEENNVEDKEDVTLNIIPFSSVEDHSEPEYIPQKKFGSKREEIRKWEPLTMDTVVGKTIFRSNYFSANNFTIPNFTDYFEFEN